MEQGLLRNLEGECLVAGTTSPSECSPPVSGSALVGDPCQKGHESPLRVPPLTGGATGVRSSVWNCGNELPPKGGMG